MTSPTADDFGLDPYLDTTPALFDSTLPQDPAVVAAEMADIEARFVSLDRFASLSGADHQGADSPGALISKALPGAHVWETFVMSYIPDLLVWHIPGGAWEALVLKPSDEIELSWNDSMWWDRAAMLNSAILDRRWVQGATPEALADQIATIRPIGFMHGQCFHDVLAGLHLLLGEAVEQTNGASARTALESHVARDGGALPDGRERISSIMFHTA